MSKPPGLSLLCPLSQTGKHAQIHIQKSNHQRNIIVGGPSKRQLALDSGRNSRDFRNNCQDISQ
jgi:hypothetical protein